AAIVLRTRFHRGMPIVFAAIDAAGICVASMLGAAAFGGITNYQGEHAGLGSVLGGGYLLIALNVLRNGRGNAACSAAFAAAGYSVALYLRGELGVISIFDYLGFACAAGLLEIASAQLGSIL